MPVSYNLLFPVHFYIFSHLQEFNWHSAIFMRKDFLSVSTIVTSPA